MSDPQHRKPKPTIKEEVDRELDGQRGEPGQEIDEVGDPGKGKPVLAPKTEPQTYSELVDLSKLKFGQKLIYLCIVLVVILCLVDYFGSRAGFGGVELGHVIEMLKLVTTTALGFVFAKTQVAERIERDNEET
ncbi:MAG: hypothetical protein Q4D85_13095 [Corynebacterium sp.]|uniref:hypothetical protein n=1 Tax=Corynebacterium sp. TaxID=1720 RepID=UPI0026DDAB92|nr:hypothetical protein [Corynebacterium sp.]MDO5099670.1 hypothetical protein [Corynebacterium sp.]